MKNLILILISITIVLGILFAGDERPILELELPSTSNESEFLTLECDRTISIDYRNKDVREILTEVAEQSDLNLVIPDNLEGKTSIKLHNVTWRQILEVLLSPLDYTYIENRNIIELRRISQLTTEPVDTRVFIVNYTRASDISVSLSPLIDKERGGTINVDTRSNALVVTERPSRMNKIQEIIERLDRPTAQVLVEGKLFEINGFSKEGLEESYSPSAYQELVTKLGLNDGARFIADFNLTTLDGSTAKIGMTEEIDSTSSKPESSDSEFDITVTPEVNSAGFIKLSVDAVVKSVIEEDEETKMVTKRNFASRVSIKDGYTVTIGGIGTATRLNHSSAPTAQKQFIIFLTAKTLNPDGFDYDDTLDPRILHRMNILEHEIPGYFPSKTTIDALKEIRRNRNQNALENIDSEYQNEINTYVRETEVSPAPESYSTERSNQTGDDNSE